MGWSRGSRAFTVLLLISAVGCDGREPLAPSFMFVGAPGSFTATAVAFNQINLTWQDNSTNETGFEVYQSTTGPAGSFSLLVTTGPRATSYSDFGVVGSKEYCYEVRAFRTTGRKNNYSDFSAVACATTPRSLVPAPPSAVNAAPYNGYAVHVTWMDNSTDESNFRIERSGTATGPWTAIATFSANSTSLYDYQVAREQLACYRVFALNSYGDSDPSNVFCTAIPNSPTDLAATVVGAGVNLTWIDHSSVEDGFNIYRTNLADGSATVVTVGANTTAYHDEPPPDNTYFYGVSAGRDGGTSWYTNNVQVVIAISAPAAPNYADASPAGSNTVGIFWSDPSLNETGFRVERLGDGATWTAAGNAGANATVFWDYPVPSEELVCYRVVAFNLVGDSPPSDSSCTKPPAAPTVVAATPLDAETIEFTWTDNSNVEQGYQVWLDDGYDDPLPIATLDANVTSFQYVDPYGYYYSYFVVAIRDGGMSDRAWFETPAPPGGSAAVRGSPSRVTPRQRGIKGRAVPTAPRRGQARPPPR
ncbi:MAG: fibronectin type III domain-containing protein [Chloroflexi bacterium]|nr:MAG: fibronectin type III domain-containing protein [Chloroflexota bacterium]